jgi:hypothetical protein
VTVFADQATKDFSPPDGSNAITAFEADVIDGWQLLKRSMRAVDIVVALILGQHLHEVPLAEDQHPVQTLAADSADAR